MIKKREYIKRQYTYIKTVAVGKIGLKPLSASVNLAVDVILELPWFVYELICHGYNGNLSMDGVYSHRHGTVPHFGV